MNDVAHGEPVVLARAESLQVGALAVEPSHCRVRNTAGREQVVEPRIMQVLVALCRAQGGLISRDDLIASCWSGRVVSNDAVSRVISILRALSQDIGAGSFTIETLNKVGYRLVEAPVSETPQEMPAPKSVVAPGPVRYNRRIMLAVAGCAGVAAFGGGGWLAWRNRHVAGSTAGDPTLMILPIETDAADLDLVALARNASETLRSDVSRVPGLRVINGLTSSSAARRGLSGSELRTDTGATLVLWASLGKLAGAFRLILTLTDTLSGDQLWSTTADAPLSSPLDLQRDAAGAVIEQLVLRLPVVPVNPEVASQRRDPEAYRLSEQARAICDDIRELLLAGDLDKAQDQADRAADLTARSLALDPENPNALTVTADLTRNGWPRALAALHLTTQQRVERATGLLRRALRSDPTNAAAMARLADIYRRFAWRWNDAETLFLHALANDPANADAHWAYSHELATLGRAVDGLGHALTLWSIDNAHLWRRITFPRMLFLVGAREEALSRYYHELKAAPGNPYLLYEIYYLHVADGSRAGVQTLIANLAELWEGHEPPEAVQRMLARCQAMLKAMAGQPQTLTAILDDELARFDTGGLTQATLGGRARDDIPFILAIEYACAGDYAKAIMLLDRALQAMSVYWIASLPYGEAPFPAGMRNDPRFQALWQRDPRMADVVQRRRRAAASGQMAAFWPDGKRTRSRIPPELQKRIDTAMVQTSVD